MVKKHTYKEMMKMHEISNHIGRKMYKRINNENFEVTS
jgi:hypothetical protein